MFSYRNKFIYPKYYLFITEDINSENPVEESYWVEGAELADYYGADVINSSLGYFGYDMSSGGHMFFHNY